MKKHLGIILLLIFSTTFAWSDDHKSFLGIRIQEVTKEIADAAQLDSPKGALIASVSAGSPADKAGIKPGDIILKVDGKSVDTMRILPKLISEIKPGRNVIFEIWKNEKKLIYANVTVGAIPYKTGYYEDKLPGEDVYPRVIRKAYYEKDCFKHGETIIHYTKERYSIFKGFGTECRNDRIVIHEGVWEHYENGKLDRTLIFKESLPENKVNSIDIDIDTINKKFIEKAKKKNPKLKIEEHDWIVKRDVVGELSGKIYKNYLIKKFDGTIIKDWNELYHFLNSKKTGDFINLTVLNPKENKIIKEKIKINRVVNKEYVSLSKGDSDRIFPFIIKKMAHQTSGRDKKIEEDIFLLTSIKYFEILKEDYDKLYKYYDEVSKTKSSNLPKKPNLKKYVNLINKIKNTDVAKSSETKESEDIIPASSGTGFFISKEGHIITNNHVIDSCHTNKVNYQGNVVAAKILARDRINDLALLRADIKPKDIFNISTDDADLLEEIYVAGYPFGKAVSSSVKVTRGVVSALSGLGDNYSNIQIDAALQPGNSGGPIINNKGNVVGIAVSKLDYEKVMEAFGTIPENTNFGIKSSVLQTFVKSNNLNLPQTKSRGVISTKQIGDKVKNATVYLGCWMTAAKIEEMQSKKTFFLGVGKGFDFPCYNSCKDRNDESFCRKQCTLE